MTPKWLDRVLDGAALDGADREETTRILLVDDTPVNLRVLTDTLRPLGLTLLLATKGEQCLAIAKRSHPTLVLLDVMMPEIDGFEVCRRMKADPQLESIPVVFCSALDDAASRVRGLELGAVDFITKPFDPAEVVARVKTQLTIDRLMRGLTARNRALQRELSFARDARLDSLRRMQEVLVGTSAPVRELRNAIAKHARTDEPLLLEAEPGCGAEAVARAIHDASARREHPFLVIECPLLRPADVSGIFSANTTSAQMLSRLESTRGGTVFFDGLHRMIPELRDPLFALIDELDAAVVEARVHPADVRVICSATTSLIETKSTSVRDLWGAHARSRKLIRLPTLAERRDDIPALVGFFAERHARLVGRNIETVSEMTLSSLARHWWPGNLRELEEVVRSGVLRSQQSTLDIDLGLLADGIPFGNYRLMRKLSEGGMGSIWEAQHQLLARPAVVKLIRAETSMVRGELEMRFELEAKVTAKLRSPHTVTLFDYGISADGDFYYVMEKLEGVDLEQAVKLSGAMPASRVVSLLIQVCSSLIEAHSMGLVHRDIKPANLFLCKLGVDLDVLKVLDFGMVKWLANDDPKITRTGIRCGTPSFMSPEAISTQDELDGRVDIYALGCVAYWMLTATLPFEGDNVVAVLRKQLREEPVPPSKRTASPIPDSLESIVMRCLSKSRDERPNARQLLEDLSRIELPDRWESDDALAWWNEHLPHVMHGG